MFNFHNILVSLLEKGTQALKADLKLVESTWVPAKRHLVVRHNQKDTIEVFAGIEYKAYVPKKYYAWKVNFTEWNGEDIENGPTPIEIFDI